MTQKHPITPPPELVNAWDEEATHMFRPEYQRHLAARAAHWGADEELDACYLWVSENYSIYDAKSLLSERRPRPKILKSKALEMLDIAQKGWGLADSDWDALRRVIELLPEDYET